MALTEMSARKLPDPPDVIEMDVSDEARIEVVASEIATRWEAVDGILHAVAYAPPDALGGAFLSTPWKSVEAAFKTSAYSLKSLATGFLPLMTGGGSIVSLDFDASVAWPIYDWMGVSKAALESISRYLARDLGRYGIRVNSVSSGPIKTTAAKGIPGFDILAGAWERRAPLGWEGDPSDDVAGAIGFLMSDLSSRITGEIIHVDGGFHAIGAEGRGDLASSTEGLDEGSRSTPM
jgi:enoyl-[acyl-carrier protein] reductase I